MPPTRDSGILTVAAIREAKGVILFNEREQIFTLPETQARGELSKSLREALERKLPVKAVLDPKRGLVQKIEPASEGERREFERGRTLLDKPEKTVSINVSDIDPTRFNIVDVTLKVPVFKLCTKIVPSYKKAKEIFDYCAQQSCHLGPTVETPCIPFQYVRDGCYARAHKMRKIITEKYGYCCEKVFSFAIDNDDTLAVRADKWGGCCVFWWYHVAPLIRIQVKILNISFTLALVIDPSMFDKPVLLSSWLMAQENKSCSADAHVSKYSIQPGSAYWPANGDGTAFGTDPTYALTNGTLIAYQGLTTC
jgi:glutaminase-like protein